MKKHALLLCVLILLVSFSLANANDLLKVNGYLHEVDGQRVLHVWGSHFEMGYAQGYILADEIVYMMNNYALSLLPDLIYFLGHMVVPYLFEFPEEYLEEAHGIIEGINNSNANSFLPALGRKIDVSDLVFANALGDMGAMACSTQIAWDKGTMRDPMLQGETAMVRNLDWTLAGPDKYLLSRNTIVIVYTPSTPNTNSVASVTFPGFIGCLSCMNEQGVSVALNIAHNGIGLLGINYAQKFTHIEVTLRQALHAGDLNGDGVNSIQDVIDNVADSVRSGAFVINIAQPLDRTPSNPAVILETDNTGWVVREPWDEPAIPQNVLISTNDLRKLYPAPKSDRYATMKEIINDLDGELTLGGMWAIEGDVVQDKWLSTTAQTIYFIPYTRELGVAFTDSQTFSVDKAPSVIPWDRLIELPEGVDLPESQDDDDDDSDPVIQDNCDYSDSDEEENLCCGI